MLARDACAHANLEEKSSERSIAIQILTAKLYVPPTRANAILRPQLVERLLTGVARSGSFSLVAGPAGSGKTSLLSTFVASLRQPLAWVSLDGDDNNPLRFWTYLIKACQSVLGDTDEPLLALLRNSPSLPDDTIPTLLINELSTLDQVVVLVLDDYHEIRNPSIHAGLQYLLDYLPPNLHLIVSTRIDPPWPLARYRARNQLTEIRAQDLRFGSDETRDFLHHTMELDLSAEDVATLEERTEGWIAGLQLAALSLQGHSDTAAFIRAFTGSHVYVAEYLLEEVLQQQPEDVQSFLLQTSILEHLNPGLCEAVAKCQDGQAILRDLYRANVFIVPLDDTGYWFRYHQLFRDLLRVRLRAHLAGDAIAALQRRAAEWYQQHGYVREAVNHVLAAREFEWAASLVDQAGLTMIFTDHYTLSHWLDSLPDAVFHTHPRLEVFRVLLDLSMGKLDMYEQTLLEKEKMVKALPPSPENDRLRLQAMVYLCLFLAHQNPARAIQVAHEALAEIPEGDLRLRAYLFSALYRAYGMEGDIQKSAPAYQECLRLAQAAGDYGMVSVTTMVRAFDLCQYGRLDEAVSRCQAIVEAGARSKQKEFYPAGPSYIGLAGIYLERNDLDTAEEYLTRGIDLCHRGGIDGLYTGNLQMARLRQARGDNEGALQQLHLLEQAFQRRDFTLTARQVSVRLALGDLTGAGRLVASLLDILGKRAYARQLPLIAAEAFKLSLARIYIAQGELARARQLLDEVHTTAEPGKRMGRLMEVYLLHALLEQKGQTGASSHEAIRYVAQALALAEPAGFVLLFLEEGPALMQLLDILVERRSAPKRIIHYATQLLNAFARAGRPVAPATLPGEAYGLIEPLTPREMEVLQLIAIGDSNQAIADQLVITLRTVKKHISNILGKLEVNNRTQAAARARDLGLITSE